MSEMNVLDWTAYGLMVFGSVNAGLGVFGWNILEMVLNKAVLISSVYTVIGVAGVYALVRIPYIK